MELSETTLLQLSRAKDGDVLVVKCRREDMFNYEQINYLCRQLKAHCGKNIAVIGIDEDRDLQLLEASEARAILERLAGG